MAGLGPLVVLNEPEIGGHRTHFGQPSWCVQQVRRIS